MPPPVHAVVKPGRKIFLYINAVHPKEVIIDDDNHPTEYALKGESHRSAIARLEELGFKNVRIVKVLGSYDRVVKILANGRPVRKMQKIPVNCSIVVEVSDGRLNDVQDSLQNAELLNIYGDSPVAYPEAEAYGSEGAVSASPVYEEPAESQESGTGKEEEGQYF